MKFAKFKTGRVKDLPNWRLKNSLLIPGPHDDTTDYLSNEARLEIARDGNIRKWDDRYSPIKSMLCFKRSVAANVYYIELRNSSGDGPICFQTLR